MPRALGAHGASVAVRSVFATCRAAIPRFRGQGSGAIINATSAPDECVGAFLFLLSERLSSYVTGQVLEVNGGQFMP